MSNLGVCQKLLRKSEAYGSSGPCGSSLGGALVLARPEAEVKLQI